MKDPNEVIFTRATLESAMATNCSYYHGMSVQDRFDLETGILIEALNPIIKESIRVMDFGLGVGRVARALLEKYPNVNLVGVDNSESMLHHAREYIPKKYFERGRIKCFTSNQINEIPDNSIDFILGIYVLQHIDSALLPQVLDQWSRISKEEGKIYVLNCNRRAVPRQDRFGLYNELRRLFGFFEYHCEHKQIQRLSIKLDNKCLFYDDGIDIQQELAQRYTPEREIHLNVHPHMEKLMGNHFSIVYTNGKRTKPSE